MKEILIRILLPEDVTVAIEQAEVKNQSVFDPAVWWAEWKKDAYAFYDAVFLDMATWNALFRLGRFEHRHRIGENIPRRLLNPAWEYNEPGGYLETADRISRGEIKIQHIGEKRRQLLQSALEEYKQMGMPIV